MVQIAESGDFRGMSKRPSMPVPKPQRRRLFIKEWRKYRQMTQETLAERAGMSIGNVNHLEQAKQGYTQEALEALANALNCSPAHLIMVDPTKGDAIWSIWDQAKPGERQMIVDIAKTITKTGT